jgi:hypothetical protein
MAITSLPDHHLGSKLVLNAIDREKVSSLKSHVVNPREMIDKVKICQC